MDKLLHFMACFFATVSVTLCTCALGMLPSFLCGGLFALGLGLGKEYGDSKASGNKWSWADIVADVLGIAVALLLVWIGWRD